MLRFQIIPPKLESIRIENITAEYVTCHKVLYVLGVSKYRQSLIKNMWKIEYKMGIKNSNTHILC